MSTSFAAPDFGIFFLMFCERLPTILLRLPLPIRAIPVIMEGRDVVAMARTGTWAWNSLVLKTKVEGFFKKILWIVLRGLFSVDCSRWSASNFSQLSHTAAHEINALRTSLNALKRILLTSFTKYRVDRFRKDCRLLDPLD
jgi:hypothetical protein